MADDTDTTEKTEDPTQKRLDEALKRGDVVKSQEVGNWFMIAGSGVLFALFAPATVGGLANSLKLLLANADRFEIGGSALTADIAHQMYLPTPVVFTTGIADAGDYYIVAHGEADLACRITHTGKERFR